MSAPGSLSALREATFDNLQLNCGIFVKDLVYTGTGAPATAEDMLTLIKGIIAGTVSNKGDLLGVTRGGGTFTVGREMRNPDIDGLRYRFKGGTFVDSADPQLSTTLVETTPENFALALGGTATTSGKMTTVTMQTALDDNAYIDNLCWAGELSDGRIVLISLFNALQTADFSFTFQDKSEGALSVEFHACQDEVDDYDVAPFEIIFFGHAT